MGCAHRSSAGNVRLTTVIYIYIYGAHSPACMPRKNKQVIIYFCYPVCLFYSPSLAKAYEAFVCGCDRMQLVAFGDQPHETLASLSSFCKWHLTKFSPNKCNLFSQFATPCSLREGQLELRTYFRET